MSIFVDLNFSVICYHISVWYHVQEHEFESCLVIFDMNAHRLGIRRCILPVSLQESLVTMFWPFLWNKYMANQHSITKILHDTSGDFVWQLRNHVFSGNFIFLKSFSDHVTEDSTNCSASQGACRMSQVEKILRFVVLLHYNIPAVWCQSARSAALHTGITKLSVPR